MVQSRSDRLQQYWPANRPPVERPLDRETNASEMSPGETWAERLAAGMGERPILTLAAAAATGLVLGWLVKRK
jgi:hypothetical protein